MASHCCFGDSLIKDSCDCRNVKIEQLNVGHAS